MTSLDRGPWTCTGATSTSRIVTSMPESRPGSRPQAHVAVGEREPKPVLLEPHQDRIVDDAAVRRGSEHVFSLADGAFVMSRGTIMFVKSNASGPEISICRSTPTSHIVTAFNGCQYSATGLRSAAGGYVWLYTLTAGRRAHATRRSTAICAASGRAGFRGSR